ncbi:MAG: hypothetical protein IPG88_24275 [Gemmatimonadetes bacterium]|nr:hypothetical protein [Gemmatimonadota bacterium]
MALTAVLMLIPLLNVAFASLQERRHHLLGLSVNLAAFALALGILWLVSRDRRQPWSRWPRRRFDVTLITTAQVIFALQTDPQVVVNSKVTFETYFIALTATCLRYDKRVALGAGVLAMGAVPGDDRLGGQQLPARHGGRVSIWAVPVGRPVLARHPAGLRHHAQRLHRRRHPAATQAVECRRPHRRLQPPLLRRLPQERGGPPPARRARWRWR